MAKVIGIDLGTSNSAAAVMEGGRPVIIPSAEGAGVARTIAAPPERDAEQIREEEKDVPIEWEEGQTILALYEVKKVHAGGGMGLVYMGMLSLYAYTKGSEIGFAIAIITFCALLAFLLFNKYPAKILPGDSLTYLLGASLELESGWASLGEIIRP